MQDAECRMEKLASAFFIRHPAICILTMKLDRRPRQSRSRVRRHPAQHRVRGGRRAGGANWAGSAARRVRPAGADEVRRAGARRDGVAARPAASEKLLLLKPMTYMNLSGRAVQAAMAFYQLTPADVMVVLDDLALPCGKIRHPRRRQRAAATTACKDIERALGTSQYPRLRIGIDPPPPRMPGKDYVLGRFTEEQRKAARPRDRTRGRRDRDVDRQRNQRRDEPVQRGTRRRDVGRRRQRNASSQNDDAMRARRLRTSATNAACPRTSGRPATDQNPS